LTLQVSIAAQNTSPPPDEIRRVVEEVLLRPHYAEKTSKVGGMLNDYFRSIAEYIEEFFAPFASAFDRSYKFAFSLREDSPILFWALMGGLSLLLVFIVFRFGFVFYKAIKARHLDRSLSGTLFSSKVVTPEQLEGEASQAGEEGELILALRLLFMAGVMRLEKASDNFYKPALTNAEYLRRFEKTKAEKPLTFLAHILNRWYAGDACDQALYEKGLVAHKRLVDLAREQS